MATNGATFETEIRKLKAKEFGKLALYLDELDCWRKLMIIVPKDETDNTPLFQHAHFRMVEKAIRQQQRSGAEIFLSEWSTMGRRRPTCKLLLDLLVKMEFFKAADYLAVDVLKIDPPARPKQGPAAVVDISDEMLEKLLKEQAGLGTKNEAESSVEDSTRSEEPAETIPTHAEQPQEEIEHSDLMKFSAEPPPPIAKFSEEQTDLIKFSEDLLCEEQNVHKYKLDVGIPLNMLPPPNYGLEVLNSGEIPRCVNDSRTSSIEALESLYLSDNDYTFASTSSSSSSSSSSISKSKSLTPSERNIPVAVLKYNEKLKKKKKKKKK